MLRSGYHFFKMLRRPRVAILAYLLALPVFVSAQSNWKEEWDKAIRAAESEEQLTLYGCCYEYDRIVEGFKKKYPKIRVATVLGSGNQLATRILAERRGDKYLPDVISAGANTIHDGLYKAQCSRADQARADSSRSLGSDEMVRRRAPLYRSGEALYFYLRRQFAIGADHLQFKTSESRSEEHTSELQSRRDL